MSSPVSNTSPVSNNTVRASAAAAPKSPATSASKEIERSGLYLAKANPSSSKNTPEQKEESSLEGRCIEQKDDPLRFLNQGCPYLPILDLSSSNIMTPELAALLAPAQIRSLGISASKIE